MKNAAKGLVGILFLVFVIAVNAQPPGQWVWVHGHGPASYGTMGVPSPFNDPPKLYEACQWTDLDGNFWMFGGLNQGGGNSALWKYDPAINQWTWISGPNTLGGPTVYGIQGLPSLSNQPGERCYGSTTWTDLQGDLWLFSGVNRVGVCGDLWKYHIATNEWTWMKGPQDTLNPQGVYGIQGVPDTANYPPSRSECVSSWIDDIGDLWLYGGYGYNDSLFGDLWRFNIATNTWTWMKGSQYADEHVVYGTKGVEDPANTPGARNCYARWKDTAGNFWLFGGGSHGYLNDLWKYNPATNNWTWISGDSVYNSMGAYWNLCAINEFVRPPSRTETRAVWTDEKGNFWMFGGTRDWSQGLYNDLWMYCVSTNQWIWQSGDNYTNPTGSWGTMNIASPTNKPDGRIGAPSWADISGHLYFFGGWTTNYAGHNDIWKYTIDPECAYCPPLTTNISELTTSGINFYPNPTTGSLTLETNYMLNKITLYTSDGRLLKSISNLHSTIYNLNLEGLSAGIYVLDCESEKGSERVKVVKY